MAKENPRRVEADGPIASLGHHTAVLGFMLFAATAPHSIAAAEISIAIVVAGWLLRTIVLRRTGIRHTKLDLPIALFLLWTGLSAFLSVEPRISIGKLQSVTVVFLFYLTQAI